MNLWWIFSRADCFPNCGCEPMMDGCWICQPMAFVSSLPYLVVGIILFLQNKNRDRLFYAWSLMLGLVALSSMFFHSTYTRASMAMDYTSIIFLMTFFFVTKLMKASPRKINLKLGLPIYYVALYLFLLPLDIWSQFYVCLAMFTIASIDFLYQRGFGAAGKKSHHFLRASGDFTGVHADRSPRNLLCPEVCSLWTHDLASGICPECVLFRLLVFHRKETLSGLDFALHQ